MGGKLWISKNSTRIKINFKIKMLRSTIFWHCAKKLYRTLVFLLSKLTCQATLLENLKHSRANFCGRLYHCHSSFPEGLNFVLSRALPTRDDSCMCRCHEEKRKVNSIIYLVRKKTKENNAVRDQQLSPSFILNCYVSIIYWIMNFVNSRMLKSSRSQMLQTQYGHAR